MYSHYFEEYEIKPEYKKEFISLWSGWLGEENYHKLDEVTEKEWMRFNFLIRLIARKYIVELVDCDSESISKIDDIEKTLSSYNVSMNKDYSQFSKYIIPDLDCIISEEWDYTYILWHKNNGALEMIVPLITEVELYHFNG